MNVVYADGVFEEMVNLSAYLAEESDETAQTFLNACDVTFRYLSENKYIGNIREFKEPTLSCLRMWRFRDLRNT